MRQQASGISFFLLPTAYRLSPIAFYKYGTNLRIFFVSPGDTRVPCASLLFRFLALLERRWLLKPLFLLTFPLAVTRNLFTAPLLLFIFGTLFSFQIGVRREA